MNTAETIHVVTSSEGGIWNMVVGVGIVLVIAAIVALVIWITGRDSR